MSKRKSPKKPNKKPKTKKRKKAKKVKKVKKAKPKKRKKRRKPKQPAFENRTPQDPDIPPGFDVVPGAITLEEAYATIEARLEDAKALLPEGYDGRIILHAYADGSVDGELYVKVPEGADTKDAEFDLFDAFTPLSVGTKFWISTGARYSVKTDDERYRRFKGMTQVQTNYQRANRANIVEEHLILRNKIIEGMDKRFGEEADSVFIRLHWNPKNEQPQR